MQTKLIIKCFLWQSSKYFRCSVEKFRHKIASETSFYCIFSVVILADCFGLSQNKTQLGCFIHLDSTHFRGHSVTNIISNNGIFLLTRECCQSPGLCTCVGAVGSLPDDWSVICLLDPRGNIATSGKVGRNRFY